jgi:F420-dependent oxidoreductase-like protein
MRVSLTIWVPGPRAGQSVVDAYVAALSAAHAEGFTDVWSPQLPWGPDVLTALAFALSKIENLVVATGVVPIQTRHPITLAQQALTVSLISGGRLRLGIGLTHPMVSEGIYGIPWDRNVRRLNEYLDGLLPLLAGQEATARGELTSSRVALQMSAAPTPPVYVAALGPQLLRIAARRTAGTVTYMAGPRTLAEHVVPVMRSTAAEHHREAEVVAGFPLCVTDEPDAVKTFAVEALAIYGAQPSYRAMLDREGVEGPADVALIGDESYMTAKLEELSAIGVDELNLNVLERTPEEIARTRAFLRAASAQFGARPA